MPAKPSPPPTTKPLTIVGAAEHNLKNLSLTIPHDALTVVTGLSGSGKSSLAFDTVYAEGQRRYIETFSPYTRQFFDKVKRPNVETVSEVRPAIAIQQRTRVLTARSTVGSMTNINDYLKILWSSFATPTCPECGIEFQKWSPKSLAIHLQKLLPGRAWVSAVIAAPVTLNRATLDLEFERLGALGFSRTIDTTTGAYRDLDEIRNLKVPPATLALVIERFKTAALSEARLSQAVEQAFQISGGSCLIIEPSPAPIRNLARSNGPVARLNVLSFHQEFRCDSGNASIQPPRPALFSYNHPFGACPTCRGFGHILAIDPAKIVPDGSLAIEDKALHCWSGKGSALEFRRLLKFCAENDISITTPWRKLPEAQREQIFNHKSRTYRGVAPWFKTLERKIYKMHVRVFLSKYRAQYPCPECHGTRLRRDALAYRVGGRTLPDVWATPVGELLPWLIDLKNRRSATLAREVIEVLQAVIARIEYLVTLGLPYLTLDRPARTLSGGETQRVNLTTALGSDLVSTHFVLDEPSVGLHARDTTRLIGAVRKLQQRGNSLLVVEHDPDCIAAADHIIELGPDAGAAGGEIVYNGPAERWPSTLPAPTFSTLPPVSDAPRLEVTTNAVRNLKPTTIPIPLAQFVVLTGVSGSGKSTLVHEVILPAHTAFKRGDPAAGPGGSVTGFASVTDLVVVDQAPLSKTPRANIATYCGIWDRVRDLLAGTAAAEARGLSRSAFSFNVDAGRCPACSGAGFIREDMQFLSDVYIECDLCLGARFQPQVLEVTYRDYNAAQFLALPVKELATIFHDEPQIVSLGKTLEELGLQHLTLGHPLSELSGGEAQRLKLVPFLEQGSRDAKKNKGSTAPDPILFIFDEPTTGLHLRDVERLLALFRGIVARGHSILCIEHNLHVIAAADWLIDLGPEGGMGGGEVVLTGTPRSFVAAAQRSKFVRSHTAVHLARLEHHQREPEAATAIVPTQPARELLIEGAREHNLKNISLAVPLRQLIALTGVSGSGKSSIAKDIIYAEGQRRYLDCLSPYARQYIKELKRPEIDKLSNVPPTICIYQHTFQPSRFSTVATMSEIYNFLRLLFAKIGTQYCPDHPSAAIAALTPLQMAENIHALGGGSIRILAPVVKQKKGTHRAILERAIELELTQVRVDGVMLSPQSFTVGRGLTKSEAHSIDYVMAKFNPKNVSADFIREGVSEALKLGSGTLIVLSESGEHIYSTERACPICHRGFFKADPEDLSFNSKRGRCPSCDGTGRTAHGKPCAECGGTRLQAVGRNLRIGGHNIAELVTRTAPQLHTFLKDSGLNVRNAAIATPILRELNAKIAMLEALGLDYVALNRECSTLSGGELQRLRLAAAMGSPLSGVLYIFDEPSIGLHPLDNQRVLTEIRGLQQRGNSVIMIEHDSDSILAADTIIDVGPGGGKDGGSIVYAGPRAEFVANSESCTAQMLRAPVEYAPPVARKKSSPRLTVEHASVNNLKDLTLDIPLQSLVVVAGVSGAGKSSLVHRTIYQAIAEGSPAGELSSRWAIDKTKLHTNLPIARCLLVDQQPIGANSRSTPASYLGIWDEMRKIFASANESKARGWGPGYFSYNTGSGRCPECKGLGLITLEMNFLADAEMVCETCRGQRFRDEVNEVHYLGRSISEVLKLTFNEAREIFLNHRVMGYPIRHACDLGIGYLQLGQSSKTLSGGESQRLKLVSELSTPRREHTLYLLDEPTVGLHKADVRRLLKSLRDIIALGHSVIVIEHDPDMVAGADHVIELGHGPGDKGGAIVFEGSPQKLATETTPWGELLRKPSYVKA